MKSNETHKNRIMDEIVRQCIPLSSDDLEPIGQIVLETLKQMESEKDSKTEKKNPKVFCLAQESICQLSLVHAALEHATDNGMMDEGTDLVNGTLLIIQEVIERLNTITTYA